MTITITPPNVDNLICPFLQLQLDSTFIGPLPTGTHWFINVAPVTRPLDSVLHSGFVASGVSQIVDLWLFGDVSASFVNGPVAEGTAITLTAQLVEPPSTVIDTGSLTGTWSNTAMLAAYLQFFFMGGGGGGSSLLAQILAAVQQTYSNSP